MGGDDVAREMILLTREGDGGRRGGFILFLTVDIFAFDVHRNRRGSTSCLNRGVSVKACISAICGIDAVGVAEAFVDGNRRRRVFADDQRGIAFNVDAVGVFRRVSLGRIVNHIRMDVHVDDEALRINGKGGAGLANEINGPGTSGIGCSIVVDACAGELDA